jgi:hypothetical protein
MSAIPTY